MNKKYSESRNDSVQGVMQVELTVRVYWIN